MIHLMMSAMMSVCAFKSWVHVPSSGIVSFALKEGSSLDFFLIGLLGCALHSACL